MAFNSVLKLKFKHWLANIALKCIKQLPLSNTKSYNIPTPTANTFPILNATGAVVSPSPLLDSDAENQPISGSLSTKKIQITQLPTNSNELYYNGTKIPFGVHGITPPSITN